MTPWFRADAAFYQREVDAVRNYQPSLALEILPAGARIGNKKKPVQDSVVCRGKYVLKVPETERHYDYSILALTQQTHPRDMPILFCDDPKLPVGVLDRHILDDCQACLGVRAEIRMKWQPKRGIVGFLQDFVEPFLAWQLYYETHGNAGPFGERKHGAEGIIEFYAEYLEIPGDDHISAFMELLVRRNKPKGHELCPCASGKKLRDCHASLVWNAWGRIPLQDVQVDLISLQSAATKASTLTSGARI